MENGFQGKEGQQVPEMTDEFVRSVSERYIELFEQVTGENFNRVPTSGVLERIERNINNYLKNR
jgi:phosphoribosylaminoimidazole-succinocarboxamide synthase